MAAGRAQRPAAYMKGDTIMIQLTLKINGEDKVFTAEAITARVSVEAFKLGSKSAVVLGNYTEAVRKELLTFVRKVFDDQFTEDEFMDGCMDSFFKVMPGILNAIVAGVGDALHEFPANPTTAATTTV